MRGSRRDARRDVPTSRSIVLEVARVKLARIGAMALLAGTATPARADRHASARELQVSVPVMSAPVLFALVAPLRRHGARGDGGGVVFARTMPMFDRHFSRAEKATPLAPELADAILRIEPIYDPTRLEGPGGAATMVVSAGTATTDDVFADRWHLADPDANVSRLVTTLALAWQAHTWQAKGAVSCQAYAKTRLVGLDEVAATPLTERECAALLAGQTRGTRDAPVPIAMAPAATVPVFAAPLPGSRMSSADFWAAQRARIAAMEGRLPGAWPVDRHAADDRSTGRGRHHPLGRFVARLGAKQTPVAAATDP